MSPAGYCSTHKPMNKALSYSAHGEWQLRQRGEQRRCPTCLRWLYHREYGPGWQNGVREPRNPEAYGYLLDGDQR